MLRLTLFIKPELKMVYIIISFVLLAAFGIYAFTKTKKKDPNPFPAHWHEILIEHVHFYKDLPDKEQKRFQKRMMEFLSEVYIDGVQTEVEELDKVLIAAGAVIPVFGFPEWHYQNLSGVLLYPDSFDNELDFEGDEKKRMISGLVGTGRFEKQMILSRKALREGFFRDADKHNAAVHEFVHLIDKADGRTDGVPERLVEKPYVIPWLKLIHKEMESINNNTSDIRKYGGTNEAEFLAVASEYFFERPQEMEKKHPELFGMLKRCFQTG